MRYDILPYERIRSLRIDKGLKQWEIAELLHVKANTYSQYEVGTLRYPIDALAKLARFYGTSIDYLVGLTDNPTPYPHTKGDRNE